MRRNDAIRLEDVDQYDAVLLSPGPGLPSEAGIMPELIEKYANSKPMLGVCLGHQALCEHFGGKLKNMREVWHGRISNCHLTDDSVLFKGLPSHFNVGHYHSWVVDESSVGKGMRVTAKNEKDWVMAAEHDSLPLMGVQFHPESVMTEFGHQMIQNWIESL